MRVVASVQAKRGSSRGLVHYIAHSKLDTEREPEKIREIFNAFADNLSVESANNSLKVGLSKGRPSNDELHHLVLSFRHDDYRKLGAGEKRRRHGLKQVTREAMKRLETELGSDRLSWAASVHLNTENPHVHIALQKQYFTTELERESLSKIPREALPHFELREGEKVLVPGFFIETAAEKMEHLIDRNPERTQDAVWDRTLLRSKSASHAVGERETDSEASQKATHERDILRRGFLAEHELKRVESKIAELSDHGHKLRFLVTDPVSGRKTRLSLRDLEQRGDDSAADPKASPARQIRTILLKMIAKEQAAKEQLQKQTSETIRELRRVQNLYRKNGWKLPVPSFTKDELDKLQDHSLETSDIRGFSYLEGVRSELERSGEIEQRSKEDLRRIAARKAVSDMLAKSLERTCIDAEDRGYYRLVDIRDRRTSLAQIDLESNAVSNPVVAFVERLKDTALQLAGKGGSNSNIKAENDRLRNEILSKVNEELAGIKKEQKTEEKKAKLLEKILTQSPEAPVREPAYSVEEIAEIDALALKLKLRPVYEKNWADQRTLIDSGGGGCSSHRKLLKADPSADFAGHKKSFVAGRALAREIAAKVQFEKAKEDLKIFTESRRFHNFAVRDKNTGNDEFISLRDVELPLRKSLLDRVFDELFEGREHRTLRRAVTSLVEAREQRLGDDVAAAKEVMNSAAEIASEFRQSASTANNGEPAHLPIFTSSEIKAIEMRAAVTQDRREAATLRTVLEGAAGQPERPLTQMLRDFKNPEMVAAKATEREHLAEHKTLDRIGDAASERQVKELGIVEKHKEPTFHGPLR